jgi:uncharacterized membrane protein
MFFDSHALCALPGARSPFKPGNLPVIMGTWYYVSALSSGDPHIDEDDWRRREVRIWRIVRLNAAGHCFTLPRGRIVVEIILLLIASAFLAPLALSILALSRANRAVREVEDLRADRRSAASPASYQPGASAARVPSEEAFSANAGAASLEGPITKPPPLPPPPARVPRTPTPTGPDVEAALGGRVASYLGAAALLIALVFFVGYAIQRGLLGPPMRVLLSGASAVALLGAGYYFRQRDARFAVLAQALTGAGAALMYFTVFAAHRLYHFIEFGPALACLALSAAATLWLACRYNSQAVAILGVLGAYLTPWLVESPKPAGLFPLVYVMFVNMPVLALYRSRPWHALPNVAAPIAVLHLVASFNPGEAVGPWPAVLYLAAAYAGLAGLNVVSMNRERRSDIRDLDLIRLTMAAGAFGIQLARAFAEPATSAAAGGPLFIAGLAHAAVAVRIARRSPAQPEAVAFTHYAALFIGAAVYMRFDGMLVYALWGLAGMVLAALPYARKEPSLRALALAFGLFGLGGVLVDDRCRDASDERVFVNARFATGVLLSLLFAMQGRFRKDDGQSRFDAVALLLAGVSFAILMVALELARIRADWALTAVSIWLGLSAFVAVGIGFRAGSRIVRYYGLSLFAVTVMKVFLVDLADLRGLERAAAFFATGLLLLALSFIYQRLSAGRPSSRS